MWLMTWEPARWGWAERGEGSQEAISKKFLKTELPAFLHLDWW